MLRLAIKGWWEDSVSKYFYMFLLATELDKRNHMHKDMLAFIIFEGKSELLRIVQRRHIRPQSNMHLK